MKTNFINMVGIEFEGGWDELPRTVLNGMTSTIKTDGSLHGLDTMYTKEIISPPLKTDRVEEWINYYCPEEVNSTCGLHIHMSMPEKYYVLLMEERFWKWFQKEMVVLGEKLFPNKSSCFWSRLEGKQEYCRKKFIPKDQLQEGVPIDRYTQINFCAYRKHKTVEFRVLPGIDNKDLACKAIMGVIRLVENYLAAASQLEMPKSKLVLREIDINGEKDIICV